MRKKSCTLPDRRGTAVRASHECCVRSIRVSARPAINKASRLCVRNRHAFGDKEASLRDLYSFFLPDFFFIIFFFVSSLFRWCVAAVALDMRAQLLLFARLVSPFFAETRENCYSREPRIFFSAENRMQLIVMGRKGAEESPHSRNVSSVIIAHGAAGEWKCPEGPFAIAAPVSRERNVRDKAKTNRGKLAYRLSIRVVATAIWPSDSVDLFLFIGDLICLRTMWESPGYWIGLEL